MASVTWGDTFSGSGALAGSSVEVGIGAWFSAGGSGLSRSASGATHAAGVFDEYIDLSLSGARGPSAAVYEFSVYGDPTIQLRAADYPMVSVWLNSSDDSMSFLATSEGFVDDYSSVSIPHPGYDTLSVIRIEVEAAETRFYRNGVLQGTLAIGVSASFEYDTVRVRYMSGGGGRDTLSSTSVLLKYIHFKTETSTGALGAPSAPSAPDLTATLKLSKVYGIALVPGETDWWVAFVPPGTGLEITGIDYGPSPVRFGLLQKSLVTSFVAPQNWLDPAYSLIASDWDFAKANEPAVDLVPNDPDLSFFDPPVPVALTTSYQSVSVGGETYTVSWQTGAIGGTKVYSRRALTEHGPLEFKTLKPSLWPQVSSADISGVADINRVGSALRVDIRIGSYVDGGPTGYYTSRPMLDWPTGPVAVLTVAVVDYLTPAQIETFGITLGPAAAEMPNVDPTLPPDEQEREAERLMSAYTGAVPGKFSKFWSRFQLTYEVP